MKHLYSNTKHDVLLKTIQYIIALSVTIIINQYTWPLQNISQKLENQFQYAKKKRYNLLNGPSSKLVNNHLKLVDYIHNKIINI